MGEERVRVMVGEGQMSRKGLLRFVLENEGFDVVAEATSTLELAQRLVIHRPDVVVLDDGIDASAVGMMREVLPAAKVVLVWPKDVTALGADARLEPSEVMTSLGSTVARVAGRGTVIAPPRPRASSQDVVVVPEPDGPDGPDATDLIEARGVGADQAETPQAEAEAEPPDREPVVLETLAGVVMEPPERAPSWTYVAPGTARAAGDRWRTWAFAATAVAALLAAFALGSILLNERTVAIRGVSGNVGALPSPGPGGGGTAGTSEVPGTYEGIVHVRAEGAIWIRANGDLRLRLEGAAHVVAQGNVRVRGDGVVNNVTSSKVRVHGNGTIRITMKDGHIRLRVQGSVTARGEGTVRVGGRGSFLITHRPLG
jgi:hypothetical protein